MIPPDSGGAAVRFSPAVVADDLLANGDSDGYAIWKRILEAVAELTRMTPAEGERLN